MNQVDGLCINDDKRIYEKSKNWNKQQNFINFLKEKNINDSAIKRVLSVQNNIQHVDEILFFVNDYGFGIGCGI